MGEGRLCCCPPRLVCGVPLLCVGVPRLVCVVVLLNGGSGGLCVVPAFGLGPAPCIVLLPLVLSSPPSLLVFAVTALLVWGCVFVTGLCHCGIAVMVVLGRKTGRCLLSTHQCCDGSACLVLSCLVLSYCVVGCGMAALVCVCWNSGVCGCAWSFRLSCPSSSLFSFSSSLCCWCSG